jgi:hypothetical protein
MFVPTVLFLLITLAILSFLATCFEEVNGFLFFGECPLY